MREVLECEIYWVVGCEVVTRAADQEQTDEMSKPRRVDSVAVAGAILTSVTTVYYIWLSSQLGGAAEWMFKSVPTGGTVFFSNRATRPVAWVVPMLAVAIGLASYGAGINSQYRRTALLLAGGILFVMGWLALLSGFAVLTIGLPLVAAGLLCVVATLRRRKTPGV
jgi:hypothetical protein